jgi:hypothetical protein
VSRHGTVQALKQVQVIVPPSARAIIVQKHVCRWLFVQVAVQKVPWVVQVMPLATPEGQGFAGPPASVPVAPPVPPSGSWQFSQARTSF